MKNYFLMLVWLCSVSVALAGDGVKGGEGLQDRVIMAKTLAHDLYVNPVCRNYFGAVNCGKMAEKLEKSELQWYDELDPNKPLKAKVRGTIQNVRAATKSPLTFPITVDIHERTWGPIPTFLEFVITMAHEGGHAIHLSEDLVTDEIIVKMLFESKTSTGDSLYNIILRAQSPSAPNQDNAQTNVAPKPAAAPLPTIENQYCTCDSHPSDYLGQSYTDVYQVVQYSSGKSESHWIMKMGNKILNDGQSDCTTFTRTAPQCSFNPQPR